MNNTLIIVPCYNAGKTIVDMVKEIEKKGFVNIVISDDKSTDETVKNIEINFSHIPLVKHDGNLGYGGSQKTLYNYAIEKNIEFIVMIHGDNQYPVKMIPEIAKELSKGAEFVLGSRFLLNPLKGGMPIYKFIANRGLTILQNIVTNQKLTEYHSGLRGYNLRVLKEIEFNNFSNNFIFDNQMLLSVIKKKFLIVEIPCETKYDNTTSSISLKNSIIYGIGVIYETLKYLVKNSFKFINKSLIIR